MARRAEIRLKLTVDEERGMPQAAADLSHAWTASVIKRETVSLTGSSFTSFSVPSGAVALIIFNVPYSATSLTLKGVSGDTGIAMTPSSNAHGISCVLSLGNSPSIGIHNAGSTTSVDLIWV